MWAKPLSKPGTHFRNAPSKKIAMSAKDSHIVGLPNADRSWSKMVQFSQGSSQKSCGCLPLSKRFLFFWTGNATDFMKNWRRLWRKRSEFMQDANNKIIIFAVATCHVPCPVPTWHVRQSEALRLLRHACHSDAADTKKKRHNYLMILRRTSYNLH